ncbi:MAG TPA: hypothetical protein P5555_07295 [Candidatus Paceibacterota bacterium]|nr:hypothetical protein [Verrucomicrobiota bacterium]HRZ44981.1 hypothetical protein [Candidatus Paceibacterota bacterium]
MHPFDGVAAAFKLRLDLTTEGTDTERRKGIGAGWIQVFILSALGALGGEKTGKQFMALEEGAHESHQSREIDVLRVFEFFVAIKGWFFNR